MAWLLLKQSEESRLYLEELCTRSPEIANCVSMAREFRLRERWVMLRTAAVNQIRSLLLEGGVTLRKGRKYVDQELSRILENAELKLSGAVRTLLAQLKVELDQLAERIATMDRVIDQTSSEHEGCKRMQAIPGIGPVTATAIVAAIGTGQAFGKGRDFAAWIGLVPRQHSTGGKQKLLGISKRGNPYLRMLLYKMLEQFYRSAAIRLPASAVGSNNLPRTSMATSLSLHWQTSLPAWRGLFWPVSKHIARRH